MPWHLYIPTIITVARLFAPAYLIPLFSGEYVFWGFLAAIAACLSDWLDGYLARRWKCPTRLGAALDILADKVLCVTLMGLGLTAWNHAWWYFVPMAILVSYHIAVILLRVIGNLLFESSRVAKTKMLVEMTALLLCLASTSFSLWSNLLDTVGILLLWVATGMSVWSILHYTKLAPDWPLWLWPRIR